MNRKLIAFRREYGVTQKDLAKVLGISEVTYGKKERMKGFKQIEIETIIEYARKYNWQYTANNLFFSE